MIRALILFLMAALAMFGQATPKFPSAVSGWQDLAVATDAPNRSVLTAAINEATLTVPVADASVFRQYNIVTFPDTGEQVMICAVAANTLTLCGRGFAGTAAAPHGIGVALIGAYTAVHHNQLAAEIKSIEEALGANLANVAAVGSQWTTSGSNISYDGNVGIGTSNPASLLQVGRYNFFKDGSWADPATPDTVSAGERIAIYQDSGWKTAIGMGGFNQMWFQAHTAPNNPAFLFYTGAQSAAPSAKFGILGNGNVGIGHLYPAVKFHVADTSIANDTVTVLGRYSYGADDPTLGVLSLSLEGNTSATAGNRWAGLYVGDKVAYRPLVLNSHGAYVGIGTVSPDRALTVAGRAIAKSDRSEADQIAVGNAAVSLAATFGVTGDYAQIAALGATKHISLMPNAGNVGIGTTAPGARLDVAVTGDGGGLRLWHNTTPLAGQGPQLTFAQNTNNGTAQTYATIKSVMRSGVDGEPTGDLQLGAVNRGVLNIGLTVQSDGKVGIGTTTPSEALDVAGTVYSSALSTGQLKLFESGSNLGAMYLKYNGSGNGAYGSIEAGDYNAYRPIALNPLGGSVLIGTTSSNGASLQVQGDVTLVATDNTRASRFLTINRGSLGADRAVLAFGNDTAGTDWYIGHLYDGGGPTPNLYVSEAHELHDGTGTLVKTPIMTFTKGTGTDAGNVGIGTTYAGEKLTVSGNILATVGGGGGGLYFRNTGTDFNNTIDTKLRYEGVISGDGSAVTPWGLHLSSSPWRWGADPIYYHGGMHIFRSAHGAGDNSPEREVMRIDTLGRVGIGTDAPNQLLHLKADTPNIRIEATGASSNPGIVLTTPANNREWNIFAGWNDGRFGIYDGAAMADRFVILPNGNTGIGAQSPNAKLEVSDASGPTIRLSSRAPSGDEFMGALEWQQTVGLTDTVARISSVRGGCCYNEGDLRFFTNPGGETVGSLAERMRITSKGDVDILSGTLNLTGSGWTFKLKPTAGSLQLRNSDDTGFGSFTAGNVSANGDLVITGTISGNGASKIANAYTHDASWTWQDDYIALPTGVSYTKWGVFAPKAASATIASVVCSADTSDAVIQLRRSDGNDFITGNLACGSAGTWSATPATAFASGYNVISTSQYVGMYAVSGTAKRINVAITFTTAY